jgi:hypothetical protein
MRIQPWIKAAFGAAALWFASPTPEVTAQAPGEFVDPQFAPPPGAYAPYYGQGMYPQGLPPQHVQPWPQVSPYYQPNVARDTTYQGRDGLWYREILNRRTDWHFSMEAIALWYRDAGDSTIGSLYVPINPEINAPYGIPMDPNLGEFVDVPNLTPAVPGHYSVSRRVFPIPYLATGTGATFDADLIEASMLAIRQNSVLGNPNAAGGIKGTTGFMNEDGSGVMFGAWWADQAQEVFQVGSDNINGIPVTQALTTRLGHQNLSPLIGMVPLNNGEVYVPDFGPGSTAKYDVLYRVDFATQAAGSNLSFYLPSILQGDAVTIRPLWGARYLHIDERFSFRGIDSGFTYNTDSDSFRPTGATLIYDQYEATLAHKIRSHLAGPEVGFRFDLGSDRDSFHVWGETIFGLVANYEKAELDGFRIGDPLADIRVLGLAQPRMLAAGEGARFSEKKDNTHVSPVFHQSVFADFELFNQLPYLKRVELLKDTRFRFGYTLMYAGKVARPADSTDWRGFPLTPTIKLQHENWFAHQLSAAIDWKY